VIKTDNYGVKNEYGTREEPKEEKSKHDPDAERIVFSCSQGIITEDEAKEMLKILEYSDSEIENFMEDLQYIKKENLKDEDTVLHEPKVIPESKTKVSEPQIDPKKTKIITEDVSINTDPELGNGKEPYVFKKTIKLEKESDQ
jgi:hypothetical protein